MRSLDYDELDTISQFFDILHHLALPALVVGLIPLASRMRQMRGSLLDVLRLDYVTTARAKGLSERTVIVKHALRNALNPMITLFGYTLGALVSGSFIVEIIFSWPGLGRITLDAILQQDQYLVMGAVLMPSMVLVVGNLIADLLLAIADPRISDDWDHATSRPPHRGKSARRGPQRGCRIGGPGSARRRGRSQTTRGYRAAVADRGVLDTDEEESA